MNHELLKKAAARSFRTDRPEFNVGDTVNVSLRIKEGEKERVQVFRGIVIGRRGGGVSETFTVRRIVNNEGVERVFPVHSPFLVGVDVVSSGVTRRAKLFYLRERVGKATRLEDQGQAAQVAAGKARKQAKAQAAPAKA